MRTYYVDKDGDIWTQAESGLTCITQEQAARVIADDDSLPMQHVQGRFGPLIPLVPDDSKCLNVLAPGIVCELGKHDSDISHTTIMASGSTVKWS